MNEDLPRSTLRDLGIVLAALATLLAQRVAEILGGLRPFADPPDDLRVHSTRGARYSGGIVIEDNAVIGGLVTCVGQPAASPPPAQRHLVTPDPRDPRGEDRAFLRGWDADPREEEPWPPRYR